MLDMQSDPICSSAGCTQYKQPEGEAGHPMDYFVPNFGMDQDIMDSQRHESNAIKTIKSPAKKAAPAKAAPAKAAPKATPAPAKAADKKKGKK